MEWNDPSFILLQDPGVIWYQGESNSGRAGDYNRVFTNLINSWRKEWRQKDLPFYFVQIAPHKDQSPLLREAQLQTWQNVKNTGMVVITDVGDSIDIHPRNKLVPGKRLAAWALAKTYRIHISYSGPLYRKARFKEGKAVLSFRYSDDNLIFQGQTSIGFGIAGADRLFYPAGAVIKGKTIEVFSPEVSRPIAVRYGWENYFEVNLYSGVGLPATPFRTDH